MVNSFGPTSHLTWKEMACKDGTPYPLEWRMSRGVPLGQVFEFIRTSCGNKPIKILSGYRTPTHNRLIGGAQNSQHMFGRALDLRPPSGMTVEEFYILIKRLANDTVIGGIGLYSTFVHVDIRPRLKNNRIVFWFGSGMKDDGI